MSNVWFCGDLHWGHKSVTKWRDFDSEEEHRGVILDNLLSKVGKRDVLWILGDSVFDWSPDVKATFMKLRNHVGDLRLTIGNHCGQHMDTKDRIEFLSTFNDLYGIHKKYGCWLTHAPVHPHELRRKWCVHGHVHESTVQVEVMDPRPYKCNQTIDDPRYFNMSLENHDYFPKDLNWLRGEMEERLITMQKYGLSLDHETGGHK